MRVIGLALWPVLLADLILHAIVGYLFFKTHQSDTDMTAGMRFVEAASALLVVIAGYRASALTGRISSALIAVAMYWVVWKSAMFGLTVLVAKFSNVLGPGSYDQAAIGAFVALFLFSPVALLIGLLGGYFGRKRAKRVETRTT